MGNRVVSQRLMEMGERIRNRRQTLRWSQEKLAEMADGIEPKIAAAQAGIAAREAWTAEIAAAGQEQEAE